MLLTACVCMLSMHTTMLAKGGEYMALSDETFFYTRASEQNISGAYNESWHEDSICPEKDNHLGFVVKTNLLYDLVSVYTFEIEFPLWDRISLLIDHAYPWWETSNKYCLEMLATGPEIRYWFRTWDSDSRDKMQGWFAGIYAMTAKYDFQLDTEIDYQGEYISAGISGGYVHQLERLFGKKTYARLEFSLAAGFLQTDFRHYLPTDDYSLLIRDKYNVGRVSYFGPTKAKISIVVPVFFKNKRSK